MKRLKKRWVIEMAIDFEVKQKARDLYIIEGMTIEEVAGAVKVSERTVANWSTDGKWAEERARHREAIASIKDNSFKLKQQLIAKALNTLNSMESIDPQDMHGFRSILAATEIKEKEKKEAVTDIDRPRVFLEDMEFVAETLKEIDPEGLKILARNFDVIVNRFKERHEKAAQDN